MPRKKEDQIGKLEDQNRALKKEIRHLTRLLQKLNKGYRKLQDSELYKEEDLPPATKEAVKVCHECFKGTMEIVQVVNRRWRKCTLCDNRSRVKIIE